MKAGGRGQERETQHNTYCNHVANESRGLDVILNLGQVEPGLSDVHLPLKALPERVLPAREDIVQDAPSGEHVDLRRTNGEVQSERGEWVCAQVVPAKMQRLGEEVSVA